MTDRTESNSPAKDKAVPPAVSRDEFHAQVIANLVAFQERHMLTQDTILRRDLFWRNARAAALTVALVLGPLIYSIGLNNLFSPDSISQDYVSLVRVEGLIDAETRSSARKINRSLQAAFDDDKARGVVILVNSPGGSPVQSSMINERIRSLRASHPAKKLWVVGEDYLTSGSYFVAVASDNICVNRSTMVGSIGVIVSGWGLDRFIDQWAIERRVFTAGANKNRLDTFTALRDADSQKLDGLLATLHQHFIDSVKDGRGDKLSGDPEVLYSGDYWTGQEALELGLVDGLCTLSSVLKDKFGVEQVRDYTAPPSLLASLSNQFGVHVSEFLARQSLVQPMYTP